MKTDTIRLSDLYAGDRFRLHNSLYTLLQFDGEWAICRVHHAHSIGIPGNRGDGLCSIQIDVEVEFEDPTSSI